MHDSISTPCHCPHYRELVARCSEAEKNMAILWKQLDDIDTAMDMHHPDMSRSFNQWLSTHLQKRFRVWDPGKEPEVVR